MISMGTGFLMYLQVILSFIQSPSLTLIIDADTANEVDDLYAIARAVRAPELQVLGITSAQFHTSPLASDATAQESQVLNEQIVSLMGVDVPVFQGADVPLGGPDIRESEAVDFIVDQAKNYSAEHRLHIVILGSCTNVASAILSDPSIIPNIHVHYLGFWHDPERNSYNKKEFNSGNDTLAVEVLLNTDNLKLDVMTATTSQHLVFSKEEVDRHLKGAGGIGELLVNRWETYTRWWTKEDPEKNYWVMWDVALIEALIDPGNATLKQMYAPPENTRRKIGIYTSIDVDGMMDSFWEAMAN